MFPANFGAYSVFALSFFFFQAEDGIRDVAVTGVQTCALPISRRRGLRRGDPHLEHALRVLRLHLGGVDALRKGEIPLERAVRDLADEIVLVRGVVIGLALALDGEDVVLQGHLNVLRIHTRQGELDDVGAVLDPSLRGGKPRRTLSGLIRCVAQRPREWVIYVEGELSG